MNHAQARDSSHPLTTFAWVKTMTAGSTAVSKHRVRGFWTLLAVASVTLPPDDAYATTLASPASITLIQEEMDASRRAIATMRLRVRQLERGFDVKQQGKKINFEAIVDVAFDGVRFMYQSTDVGKANGSSAYLFHPERPQVLFDGRFFRKYWVQNRIVHQTDIGRGMPDVARNCQYLGDLALSPRSLAESKKDQYFLPAALTAGSYIIASERAYVDEVECVMLRHQAKFLCDTLWLDPATGWTLRKRVMESNGDPLRQDNKLIIHCHEYRQAAADIWLPWKIVTTEHRRERDSTRYALIARKTMDVESLSVNKPIDDSLFKPRILPGTMIETPSTGERQVVPGGAEVIASVVARVTRHYHWNARQASSGLSSHVSSNAAAMTGLLLGAAVSLLAGRRRDTTRMGAGWRLRAR